MNRHCCAVFAVILSAATALPAIAAPACVSPAEARAMQVRQLHVQLQVASLNCRGDDPSLPGKYASYVNRFGNALNDNAKVLRGHFARAGGNMDRYMTQLANDESQRAHLVEDYCERYAPLFERLATLKAHDLEPFAASTMDAPDRPACGGTVKQAKGEKVKKAVDGKKAEAKG